jgi:hypothetical protein
LTRTPQTKAPKTASRCSAWEPAARSAQQRPDHEGAGQQRGGGQGGEREQRRGDGAAGQPGGGRRRDQREGRPAEGVVEHPAQQGQLADVPVQQRHVDERLGDHRDRRHAHRHAEEEREHGRLRAGPGQRSGQQVGRAHAEHERHRDAPGADLRRRPALPAGQPEVQRGTGEADQQQHAELADGVQQVQLLGPVREEPVRETRQQVRQQRGSEQDARAQLAGQRRQGAPGGEPPEQVGEPEQHPGLQQEDQQLRGAQWWYGSRR